MMFMSLMLYWRVRAGTFHGYVDGVKCYSTNTVPIKKHTTSKLMRTIQEIPYIHACTATEQLKLLF